MRMNFRLAASVVLDLDPRLQWLWYSGRTDSFVAGDETRSFSLPVSDPARPAPLDAGPGTARPPCNLPVPAALYEEFAAQDRRGLRFLPAAAYEGTSGEGTSGEGTSGEGTSGEGTAGEGTSGEGTAGDVLRTIVFGPNYGTYVLHPASGAVLSLRAGSLQLLQQSPEGFTPVGQARTRGRAALAFAAHPEEPLIAYGDNYGGFFAQEFSAGGFGKTRQIDARGHKAGALEFIDSGRGLLIGGTGYLSAYAYESGKFSKRHEVSAAVRDFAWVPHERALVVNQGMHGVSLYRLGETGFTPWGAAVTCGAAAVDTLAVSRDLGAIAMLEKPRQWPAPARIHVVFRTGELAPPR